MYFYKVLNTKNILIQKEYNSNSIGSKFFRIPCDVIFLNVKLKFKQNNVTKLA